MESWLVGGVIHYEIRRKKPGERLINCFRSAKSFTSPMHKYNHRSDNFAYIYVYMFIFMMFIFVYVYMYVFIYL